MTTSGSDTAYDNKYATDMVANLEASIAYSFVNKSLAQMALTHSSVANKSQPSNERMEFLGDRILGLVIAEMLYQQFPDEAEGALGYRFPALVRAEALARVAGKLGVNKFLNIDDGEFANNSKRKISVLSNTCEAIIAALYLDGGMGAAENFIKSHWQPLLEEDVTPPKDAKTMLQEWVQGQGSAVPDYNVISRSGPDHAPEFTVEVSVGNERPAQGKGPSKRAAETAAANALYSHLNGHLNDE